MSVEPKHEEDLTQRRKDAETQKGGERWAFSSLMPWGCTDERRAKHEGDLNAEAQSILRTERRKGTGDEGRSISSRLFCVSAPLRLCVKFSLSGTPFLRQAGAAIAGAGVELATHLGDAIASRVAGRALRRQGNATIGRGRGALRRGDETVLGSDGAHLVAAREFARAGALAALTTAALTGLGVAGAGHCRDGEHRDRKKPTKLSNAHGPTASPNYVGDQVPRSPSRQRAPMPLSRDRRGGVPT
ncbi:Hypothetical protein A7982_08543 [Minicystis rosea]|nr:Hypothetical protein A7982_08543 [Minicystis rosea]